MDNVKNTKNNNGTQNCSNGEKKTQTEKNEKN